MANENDKYFLLNNNPIYENTVFSRFFEENDPAILGWMQNVLKKISGNEILPTFINKDGKDFQALWGTITHLFALIVLYSRKYKEIDSNKILFEFFIENRGLVTNLVESQEQMEYLFYNYISEYEKRGRLDIIDKEGQILGELLRLIKYNNQDEFLFVFLQPKELGLSLGYSSPLWREANLIENLNKGYEFGQSVEDLSKYPLLRSSNVELIQDRNDANEIFSVMIFKGSQQVGITPEIENKKDKLILVDPNLSYEISIRAKLSALLNAKIQFGVTCFDEDLNPVGLSFVEKGLYIETESFFHTTRFLELPEEDVYYHLKGILLAHNERNYETVGLNFLSGRALSLNLNVKYICPVFIQNREEESDPLVYLYDLKIKPTTLPFEQGYLGEKNTVVSYYKNNSYQKKETVQDFIKTFLLSYKNIFNGSLLREKKEQKITFKIFSERKNYINNASIEIAGQILQTNVNGEASITLYPGEYLYSIEKENFDLIEREVLRLDSEDVVKYIQLKGQVYQRAVWFSVKEKDSNPISEANVSFAGEVKLTEENGLVLFNLYPGVYTYIVEKTDYYSVSRTVNITDSVTIDVTLETIPYYNVSFKVKDNQTPISGVAVVVTGDFDGSGTIGTQTGSTNAQGVATGFVMREGTYKYLASKPNYFSIGNDFDVTGNTTIVIPISSIPEYIISFVVKEGSIPIENATINIDGVVLFTDSTGKTTYKAVNGTYAYTISKRGFRTQSGDIVINGTNVTKDIILIAIEYKVDFVITSVEGARLPGVAVTVGLDTLITDNQGRVSFDKTNGNYNYSISLIGYYSVTNSFLIDNSNTEVNVVLNLIKYNVIFTVRDNGVILAGVPVICANETIITNSQGRSIFAFVNGTYSWSVRKDGYQSRTGDVTINTGDAVVNVDLSKIRGTSSFTVIDTTNKFPIRDAKITINNEAKYTNTEGKLSFDLPIGNYNYLASKEFYHNNPGNIEIVEGTITKTIEMIPSTVITYPLIFTIKEGFVPLVRTEVVLSNGSTLLTDEAGIARFDVPANDYSYTISNGSFFDIVTGSIRITKAENISVTLVRKKTTVTFLTRDSFTEAAISGVRVSFNKLTKSTEADGKVYFENTPMSSTSLEYIASKNPPYMDVKKSYEVTREDPLIVVSMGEYTYSVFFTIKDNKGGIIAGALVDCNGQSGYTNTEGQITFSGYKNGEYSWSATKTNYETVTGKAIITNANAYVNIIAKLASVMVAFRVQFENGKSIQGVSVEVDGQIGATDLNGEISFTLKVGQLSYVMSKEYLFDKLGSFTNDGTTLLITVVMEDTFALKCIIPNNTEFQLPILNTNLGLIKVDWGDGDVTIGSIKHSYPIDRDVTILITMTTKEGIVLWSVEQAELLNATVSKFREGLYSVAQFFQSNLILEIKQGGFKSCTKLLKIAQPVKSQIKGTPRYIFYQIGLWFSRVEYVYIPTNFFDWQENDGDFTYALSEVYLAQDTQNLLKNASNVVKIDYMLNSGDIYHYDDEIPESCVSAIGTFHFCGMNKILTVSRDIFSKASGIKTMNHCFMSSHLNDLPNLDGLINCNDLTNAFTNCVYLQSISDRIINLPKSAILLNRIFANSSLSLSERSEMIIDCPNATNFDQAFIYTRIVTLNNIKLLLPKVKSATEVFAETPIDSIPMNYCSSMVKCESFVGMFYKCRNLQYIYGINNTSPFAGTSPLSMRAVFQECSNLIGGISHLFVSTYAGQASVAKSCTTYENCFQNCSKLTDGPCETRSFQPSGTAWLFLWDLSGKRHYPEIVTGRGCYKGCENMFGYTAVPALWR